MLTRTGVCADGRETLSAAIGQIRSRCSRDLSAGVSLWINYQSREDEGAQSPTQTLARGWGSCRDFAVLFAEAARSLGFGARIISGYLFNPEERLAGSSGPGSTHARAEVYVSGAGWISFDPTKRGVGGFNLIPVGSAHTLRSCLLAGQSCWSVFVNWYGDWEARLDQSVKGESHDDNKRVLVDGRACKERAGPTIANIVQPFREGAWKHDGGLARIPGRRLPA
jgi:transglutaminase-like putative cysteine protease